MCRRLSLVICCRQDAPVWNALPQASHQCGSKRVSHSSKHHSLMKHYKHCKLLPKLQFPLVIYYQRNPTLIIWLCSRSLLSEHFMQCLKSKKMALSLVGKARHLVDTGTQCTYNYFTHGVVQDSKAIGRYTLICYTFRITHTFKYQVVHTHVSFKRIFKKKKN